MNHTAPQDGTARQEGSAAQDGAPPRDGPASQDGTQPLDEATLRRWPLPMPSGHGDKEERGCVLVIGGSPEIAGAIVLAGLGALRAGAGKLAIATAAGVAQTVSIAMPEARVIGLPETDAGGLAPQGLDMLRQAAGQADAVVIGPGMQDEPAACALVAALLPELRDAAVMLDAAAMGVVRKAVPRFERPVLLTPHAGELAHLTGGDKGAIQADPLTAAREAAARWNAVVALKGATTHIVTPQGRAWRHDGGSIGLGTSGSGDTLAGIVTGLLARGATLEQACAWGVVLHARAGAQLERRFGPLGFLAREIPAEVPALMHALSADAAVRNA